MEAALYVLQLQSEERVILLTHAFRDSADCLTGESAAAKCPHKTTVFCRLHALSGFISFLLKKLSDLAVLVHVFLLKLKINDLTGYSLAL